jgi:hypothetical protein
LGRLSALSLDRDRVAVEVVQNDPVFDRQLRVDIAGDARSRVIIVVSDEAAGDQPFRDPFRDIAIVTDAFARDSGVPCFATSAELEIPQ